MTGRFIIYGLVDPRTQELRYVGKSCSGLRRPFAHFRWSSEMAKSPKRHVMCWIRQLREQSLEPEVFVVEERANAGELDEAEVFFITYFRSLGCRLTNQTDGGEGTVGHVQTAEHRAKNRAAHLGRPKSPEAIAKYVIARKGHLVSVGTRALIARALSGRPSPKRGRGRRVVDESGVVYPNGEEASRVLGLHSSAVYRSLRTGILAGGHSFRYLEAA